MRTPPRRAHPRPLRRAGLPLLATVVLGSLLGTLPASAASTALWKSTYDGSASSMDEASANALSPDGATVFVTGLSYGTSGNSDFVTLAYVSATGAKRWATRYAGASNGNDAAMALGVSPDGSRVFVTGRSWGTTTKDDYVTVAYDAATGKRQWARRYNAGAIDDPYALGVAPDGSKVFVTGWSQNSGGDWDYATVAYGASTGDKLWARRFNGGYVDYATGLAVSPDGTKVYVGGTRYGGPSNDTMDYQTIAYNAATGTKVWTSRYNGGYDDYASMLAVSPDGAKVFITGASYDGSMFNDNVVAYNGSTGAQLWERRNGETDYHDVTVPAVAVSPDGSRIAIVGAVFDQTTAHDYQTDTYGTGGALTWTRQYNSSGYSGDLPAAATFSPDGSRLYVTGMTASGPDTFAYDTATGATVWSKRAAVNARALAISPDGSTVYITGTTDNSDYVTVAYATS